MGIVFIALLFLTFLLFIRIQQGTWFAPGAFFTLCWFIFTFVPLLFIPESDIWLPSILWIMASAFAVYIGSIIGSGTGLSRAITRLKKDSASQDHLSETRKLYFPWHTQLTIIFTGLSFLAIVFLLWSAGNSLSVFTSLSSLSQFGHEVFSSRYDPYGPGFTEPTQVIYLNIFTYVGALFGGALFASARSKRQRIISLLPLVPAALMGLLLVARTSMLVSAILWLAAYLATRVITTKGSASIPLRISLTILLITLSVAFTTQILRYGVLVLSIENLTDLWYRWHDTWAYLPAFAQWFKSHWQDSMPLGLGAATFGNIYRILGIAEPIGHEAVSVGFETTNIFTIFRELIEDFGPVGSLIWFFCMGVLSGFSFRQVVKGRFGYLPILIAFYSYVLFSQTRSCFSYTSIAVAWLILVAYLVWFAKTRKGQNAHLGPINRYV